MGHADEGREEGRNNCGDEKGRKKGRKGRPEERPTSFAFRMAQGGAHWPCLLGCRHTPRAPPLDPPQNRPTHGDQTPGTCCCKGLCSSEHSPKAKTERPPPTTLTATTLQFLYPPPNGTSNTGIKVQRAYVPPPFFAPHYGVRRSVVAGREREREREWGGGVRCALPWAYSHWSSQTTATPAGFPRACIAGRASPPNTPEPKPCVALPPPPLLLPKRAMEEARGSPCPPPPWSV